MLKAQKGNDTMTLAELLTECKNTRRDKIVRVFVGCMTLYKGNPSNMSMKEWIKLHPYFNCQVASKGVIRNTFVITL